MLKRGLGSEPRTQTGVSQADLPSSGGSGTRSRAVRASWSTAAALAALTLALVCLLLPGEPAASPDIGTHATAVQPTLSMRHVEGRRRDGASCMFGGFSDGTPACEQRIAQAVARTGQHMDGALRQNKAGGESGKVTVNCSRFINTRKHVAECEGQEPVRLLAVLVTGVGGSGTNLMTSAFKKVGVTVGHEYVAGKGTASWPHAVSDAVVGVPYPFPRKGPHRSVRVLPEESPRFQHVIHQVRCPMDNIAALTTHNNFSRDFLWRSAGVDPSLAPCLWGAHVWLRWNEHIESFADARVRIEDFESPEAMAQHVCGLTGLACSKPWPRRVADALRLPIFGQVRGHHREHGACRLEDLEAMDPRLAREVRSFSSSTNRSTLTLVSLTHGIASDPCHGCSLRLQLR